MKFFIKKVCGPHFDLKLPNFYPHWFEKIECKRKRNAAFGANANALLSMEISITWALRDAIFHYRVSTCWLKTR